MASGSPLPDAAPAPPRPRPGRGARLLVLAVSLVAGLLLGEVSLRALLDTDGYRIRPPGLETIFRPSPEVMSGVEGDSLFRINSLGLRGDEPAPEDGYRILALGGSGTECLYLDQTEAWPAVLQARLRAERPEPRAWVGNGGVSGRNTRDHVVQLRRLLPRFEGLDAVVLTCGVNDLALRLAQGERYAPLDLSASSLVAEASLLPRAFDVLPLSVDTAAPWWKRTAFWRLASLARNRLFAPERVQDEAGAIYTTWRAHRAAASPKREALPDLEVALAEQTTHLAEIARLCREHDVRLVLTTQPYQWADDLPPEIEARLWLGGIGDFQNVPGAAYYSAGALAEGMESFNGAMRAFAAAEGVECLDLAAEIGSDPAAFYDDVHLNETGARRAGQITARYLLERPPFR